MNQTATKRAPQAQQQQPQQLAKQEPKPQIYGVFQRAEEVDKRLRHAAANFHLVAPSTVCGSLPEGCEAALAIVPINVEGETYDIPGGKRGLAKVALNKIAAAAGISWDPHLSRRLDNGSDPNYVHYRAVGWYRAFDGSRVGIQAEKEMDVRDGSPQVLALFDKARAKGRDATQQIRELRLHILGHAETKAQLRAIRALGLRTSYTREELQRPFVVARIVFTGKTDDPQLKQLFANRTADAFLGASTALYGNAAPAALPAPTAPPPVGMQRLAPAHDDEDDNVPFDAIDTTVAQATPPAGSHTPAETKQAPAPDSGELSEDEERDAFKT